MIDDLPIVAAGREIPDALDRIRRYCGLRWSGGPPETWAWPYFDTVTSALYRGHPSHVPGAPRACSAPNVQDSARFVTGR